MTETQHPQPVKKPNWVARILFGVVAVVVLVLAYFVLAAFLPVWWATTIGNQVRGDLGAGVWLGMFYGFVFTLLPLMVAWQATRKRVAPLWKVLLVLVAIALATPNLLTAAILIGSSESAHNGQRILGTEATWFPVWTQISAAAAAVVFVAGLILWKIWQQRGRRIKAFKKADQERALTANRPEPDNGGKEPLADPAAKVEPSDPDSSSSGERH